MPKLFGSIKNLFARWGGRGAWSRLRVLLPSARFDYETEAGDLWANSMVSLALRWRADRVSKPLIRAAQIKRNGDYNPLPRHDVIDLWEQPNPHYSRDVMEAAIDLSLVCDGNAYVYKVRDGAKRTAQLWWLPHFCVFPQWPDDGSEFISGYTIQRDGKEITVPREDIIHIRSGIDPNNERLGLSPLKACLREACTDNEAATFTAALLRNSGVPGLVIGPDADTYKLAPQDAEKIKEKFADMFTGDQRGDLVVMGARYKLDIVGFSPEQLTLKDLPVQAMARLASACGVASMSLGLPDPNKTYANLAEANRASWSSVKAAQELVARAIRYQLLPEFGDPKTTAIYHDYTAIDELNEDRTALHTRVREDWKAGVITLATAQEALGYDVDDDGDRYYPGTGAEPAEPDPMEMGNKFPKPTDDNAKEAA